MASAKDQATLDAILAANKKNAPKPQYQDIPNAPSGGAKMEEIPNAPLNAKPVYKDMGGGNDASLFDAHDHLWSQDKE